MVPGSGGAGGGALDTVVAIETPEHVVFRWQVAGPARRALAHAIDLLLCYGALVLVGVVVLLAELGAATSHLAALRGLATGVLLVALFLVQWVYFATWEALRGTTPGKRALGLRVVAEDGRPLDARAAILRNLLRAADLLPTAYLLGALACVTSPRFQRLGDRVAGTLVVVDGRRTRGRALVVAPPGAEEVARLPLPDRLRLDEHEAIELLLRRAPRLGPARTRELAEILATPLARAAGGEAADPVRFLEVAYALHASAGRTDGPPSRGPRS